MGEKRNTVRALIMRLMPDGSFKGADIEDSWAIVPQSPIDTFAVAATLVERSGAYRCVIAPSPDENLPFEDPFKLSELHSSTWRNIGRAWAANFHPARETPDVNRFAGEALEQYPVYSKDDLEKYRKVYGIDYLDFAQLAKIDLTPLQFLWHCVSVVHGSDEVVGSSSGAAHPGWWHAAVKLMVVADMACSGVGFWPREIHGFKSKASFVQQSILARAATEATNPNNPADGMLTTLTTGLIDASFCAVMPKTRTSALGCTLRSMTHNLALLPSPGMVETRWRIPSEPPPRPTLVGGDDESSKGLNILLVPFPYRFGAGCFVPQSKSESTNGDDKWSYFNVEQRWLDRNGSLPDDHPTSKAELFKFVEDLLKKAKSDLHEIHAVVFPEMALNNSSFNYLSKELFKADKDLEFIIAGVGEEERSGEIRAGNFVAIRARPHGKKEDDWKGNHSREKHHRWKLNDRQIEKYGLSRNLTPGKNWWEGIPLGRRIIDFFVPRAGTAMTVLICEDLARADPVQTVVRAIGPNLVLAILMDGPQRKSRWPGHYAGVLADDPGCSVLTFSSLALIARGMTSDNDQSRSIAFFKNSLGEERELFLPQASHALALRLSASAKTEHSLDGRSDGGAAFIWQLREVTPVRGIVDDSTRWIVEGST